MKDKENYKLKELIKDLECLVAANHERLQRISKYSSEVSLFDSYREGYEEGITLAARMAKHYLKKDLSPLSEEDS